MHHKQIDLKNNSIVSNRTNHNIVIVYSLAFCISISNNKLCPVVGYSVKDFNPQLI